MIEQGEIYLADLDATTPHPVLVVSREELNRGDRFVAVLITSGKFALRSTLPNCVPFHAGQFGLTKDCVAQCENIFLVDVRALRAGALGKLDDTTLREVIKAIGYVMSSDCEPI
jgi:mRNA-degrading endonuclease toxin of MazEF toxin-antitoxin module